MPTQPTRHTATNPADGVELAWRDFPASPTAPQDAVPVLMLHGTALSQVIWRGFGYTERLQAQHRVITMDLRGHGRSGKPHDPSAYDMQRFVDDAVAVLDAAGEPRAHVVGYSLGARIAFSLAVAHPDSMARLVSIGGAPRTGHGAFDRVFFPGCVDVLEHGGMTAFLDAWNAHVGGRLGADTKLAFQGNDAVALATYMRRTELDAGVSDEEFARIAAPLLLIAGTRDEPRLRIAHHLVRVGAKAGMMPPPELLEIPGGTHSGTPRTAECVSAVREFLG